MRRMVLALVLSFGGFASAHAADALVGCPHATETGASLRYVSFFDGDPSEMVELAPDDASESGRLDLTWQFSPKRERPLTMVCLYENSSVSQKREVPESTSVCKLTGEVDDNGTIKGTPILVCQ